jgi:hypothetical protein
VFNQLRLGSDEVYSVEKLIFRRSCVHVVKDETAIVLGEDIGLFVGGLHRVELFFLAGSSLSGR